MLVVSSLARVEVPAALWRKHRLGELESVDAEILTAAFEADYHGASDTEPRFAAIALSTQILDGAAELTATQGLRALDAIQLASALAARRADSDVTAFACYDADLRLAAAKHRFGLVPADERR